MRWDCERDGCFNVKRRPKIEVFADCFPRRINFGDVDGLVELSGKFCLLEWKGDGGELGRGQVLSFKAFTKIPKNVVFVVRGDAETMQVEGYSLFTEGQHHPLVEASLDDAKDRIRRWCEWVNKQ